MPRMLRIAIVCLFAFPATAWAGQATIVSQDLPVGNARVTAGAVAPSRFNLVAFHWRGAGQVLFRTHAIGGRWSSWRPIAPEEDDRPDAGSPESKLRRGWRLGSPYWVGASDRIAYRTVGKVTSLQAWYVWSPVGSVPVRTVAMAGTPPIITRSAWGANEEIERAPPRYASHVTTAFVHHTAGSNTYTRAQSAAIVRGIQLYHVKGNGWNDIGYNFLVDKYGQIFEGRGGGIARNVIGAHVEGFNTGSFGVSVIGNYSATRITPATEHALVELLAWRLDVAHVDPLSTVLWHSGGNPKYARGKLIRLRAISGHRDADSTDCPGEALYAKLPEIAREVAATGLPKLYDPVVTGGLGGNVAFTARLSAARPWMVTIRNAAGRPVARGAGTSLAVSWTWNSQGAVPGAYSWTIEAGPNTRPAQGTIGKAPPPPPPPPAPLLAGLTVVPGVLSPDGDGIDDTATISYTLSARASVTATIADSTGAVVATLFAQQMEGARTQAFPYDPSGLADGTYTLTISASGEDGRSALLQASFAVDRTLTGLTLSTQALTPNGDGADDVLGIGFTLAVAANVTVQIEQAGALVASVFTGQLPAGPAQVSWDGGTAPTGSYDAVVLVDGPFGLTRHSQPFTITR